MTPAAGTLRAQHRRLAAIGATIVALGALLYLIHNDRADELFVLGVAPSVYLLWHFHHANKYKHESTGLLIGTFALGGLFTLIAAFIEPNAPQNAGIGITFLYYLFGVAAIEETGKFLVVRFLPYRSKQFDETMDGVIFGIAAGLGFAAVENVFYAFTYGGTVALFRAFVSVPGHAFYGAIMGYYLAEAKVRGIPWLALRGLVLAILLHGIFDTLAQDTGWFALLILPVFVWFVYFAIVRKEIVNAQKEAALTHSRVPS